MGREWARLYTYPRPACSAGREKDEFVCGAWGGGSFAEESRDGKEGGWCEGSMVGHYLE